MLFEYHIFVHSYRHKFLYLRLFLQTRFTTFFIFRVICKVCDVVADLFFALGVEFAVVVDELLLISGKSRDWCGILRDLGLFLHKLPYS